VGVLAPTCGSRHRSLVLSRARRRLVTRGSGSQRLAVAACGGSKRASSPRAALLLVPPIPASPASSPALRRSPDAPQQDDESTVRGRTRRNAMQATMHALHACRMEFLQMRLHSASPCARGWHCKSASAQHVGAAQRHPWFALVPPGTLAFWAWEACSRQVCCAVWLLVTASISTGHFPVVFSQYVNPVCTLSTGRGGGGGRQDV
jgi:hypothetical protein